LVAPGRILFDAQARQTRPRRGRLQRSAAEGGAKKAGCRSIPLL